MSITPTYNGGSYYKVPCVPWRWHFKFSWWPVLGPMHEDAQIIGFPQPHYHLDYRFLSAKQWQLALEMHTRNGPSVYRTPLAQVQPGDANLVDTFPFTNQAPPPNPTMMRRRCNHVFPPYPQELGAWRRQLEDAYECVRMKSGICPHQGAPLDGLAVVDGIVTCPLHGLQWEVETGKLVRTTAGEDAPRANVRGF